MLAAALAWLAVGSTADTVDEVYCWLSELGNDGNVVDHSVGLCDRSVSVSWFTRPPQEVFAKSTIDVEYEINVAAPVRVQSIPSIIHTNIHICKEDVSECAIKRVIFGDNDNSTTSSASYGGSLINMMSQRAPPQKMNLTGISDGKATVRTQFVLDEGKYTVIAHARFIAVATSTRNRTQYDMEVSAVVQSNARQGYLTSNAELLVVILVGGLILYFLGMSSVLIQEYHLGSLKRRAFFLSQLGIGGAIVFVSTVFFWNLEMGDSACVLVPWQISLGFTCLALPLVVKSIYGFLFGMRARLAGSPSVLLEVATIKYRKSLIAGFLLGGLICIDVLCSMLYVIIGQPQALEPGYSGAYRDHCRLQEGAVGCLYALAATNIFVLSVTAITLWMYNGVGIRKVEHVKLRESVTKAFTACSSVFVLQTAFDQDRVLMFLVRSFMMIYVAFVSTSWIRNEYKQRQALFTFGRQNTEKNSLGKGKSEKGMRELSSVKAFNLLFRSPVVRGYLYHHCVKTVDTESVEFCSAVLEFKENPSVEGAEAILDTYVRDTSPHPINISGGEKRKLEERFQELKAEVQKAFAETKENPSDKEKPQHQLTTTHVVISPPINDPRLAKLRGVFNKTFKTVRTLVYINHWRAFGDSKYGITAGSILQWLGFIDGFCQEEQVWIYEHIRMGIESSINHERMRNNTDTKDASENQRRRFVRRGSHDGKGIITLNQISSSKKKMKPVAKSPGTEENWAVNRAGSSLVTNRQSTLFRARSSTYLHNESVSSAAHGRHASMTSNLSPINTYRGVDNAQSMVSECDSRARTPLVVSDRAETPKAEAGRRGGREARASRRNGPA